MNSSWPVIVPQSTSSTENSCLDQLHDHSNPSTHTRHSWHTHILYSYTHRYTRYLLEALKRRELFGWLDLAPVRWWHALLFRDAYNWGGIEAAVAADMWRPGAGARAWEVSGCTLLDSLNLLGWGFH